MKKEKCNYCNELKKAGFLVNHVAGQYFCCNDCKAVHELYLDMEKQGWNKDEYVF